MNNLNYSKDSRGASRTFKVTGTASKKGEIVRFEVVKNWKAPITSDWGSLFLKYWSGITVAILKSERVEICDNIQDKSCLVKMTSEICYYPGNRECVSKGFKRDEKQRSDDTNDYLDRVYGLHFEGEVKAEHQGHPLAPQPEIPVWKWEGISYGYCEPNILAKVSPWKGVVRFGKKGKLASRFVGPFEIIEKEGP
ncbi:hypothetical protein Tco_1540184 [Tanacetum coccineum]